MWVKGHPGVGVFRVQSAAGASQVFKEQAAWTAGAEQ